MPRGGFYLILLVAAGTVACSSEEEHVIDQFFSAVRIQDKATLAAMSSATYPWDIESWEVVETETDTLEPFRWRDLLRQADDTKRASEKLFQEFSKFRMDNYDQLRIVDSQLEKEPDCQFQGKLAAVHQRLLQYRSQLRELERRRQDLLDQVDTELRLARMSLMGGVSEFDPFEGDVAVKKVRVLLTEKEGTASPHLVTLRRYHLTHHETSFKPRSRWIVAELE